MPPDTTTALDFTDFTDLTDEVRIPVGLRFPFDELILKHFRRCTPRLLVVTDSLGFGPNGFGLSRFLTELGKATPAPVLTTRIHGAAFHFDDGSVDLAAIDQVWLFGANGPALSSGEVGALAAFMERGGGVFATGDHEQLGNALCGALPRVRKMRNWTTVPMVNGRHDTVTHPGPDHITQFDDQSDDIPQRIFPTYYGSGSSWAPHALLRSPVGDIDVLPDHPHESECLVGEDLGDPYQLHGLDLDEFPDHGGAPLAPEIVAHSVSAGRFLNPPGTITGKPPTTPKVFGAISAWDGHKVTKGRIVCDATWHHFVNVNLDGTSSVQAPGNHRDGLSTVVRGPMGEEISRTFTPEFHQIATYYRNIMSWLTPSTRRWCGWWRDLVIERFRFPLFEEFVPLPEPHPCPWDPRVKLGRIIEEALTASRGRGAIDDLVAEALDLAGLPAIGDLVRPARVEDDKLRELRGSVMVNADEVRLGVVGSIADALLRDLPSANDPELEVYLEKFAAEHDDGAIEKKIVVATREAIDAYGEHVEDLASRTVTSLKAWRG